MTSEPRKPAFFALYSDESFQAEVEKGNITQDDIDNLNALSSRTRLYRNVGLYGGAAAATYYARFNRKPPWSFPKTAFFATVGSIGGLAMSSVLVAASLYRSFSSFQDKDRFKQAVENLRASRAAEKGLPVSNGPMRAPGSGARQEQESGEAPAWTQQNGSGTDGSACTYNAPVDSISASAGGSRWDSIRAANNSTKSSTWDRIREQRTKADMPPSSSSSSQPPPPTQPTTGGNPFFAGIPEPTPRPTSRPSAATGGDGPEGENATLDREQFDKMLEAERNFGQEDGGKKGTSRWS